MSMKNHQESGKKVKQRKAQNFFYCVGKTLLQRRTKKRNEKKDKRKKNCMRCVYCFRSIKGSFK